MLTLVFKPQDTVTDGFGITSPKWSAVAKIEIRAVKSIELVEGSMPTTVFQDEKLENLSATAQFKITYTDKTYAYVDTSTPGFNMVIPENATATAGNTTIKVSYKTSASFDIPFNRQQLADYLSVDRSALSNELSKMQKEGLLSVNRSHFVLLENLEDEI